jgi:hypothetical protein
MAEIYKIGVAIALTNQMSPALNMIATQLLGIHSKIGQIEKGFGRWAVAIGGAAAVMAGDKILHGMKSMVEEGDKLVSIQEKLILQGVKRSEVEMLTKRAVDITNSVKGTDVAENLNIMSELRSSLGTEDAGKFAEKFAEIDKVTKFLGGKGDSAYELMRAGHLSGLISDHETHQIDPAKLDSVLDQMLKVTEGTSGKVSAQEWLNYMKQAGAASGNLTPEGLASAGVIMQDMGGYRGGTAVQALNRQFVGGKMASPVAEELERLGVLAHGGWEKTKGGGVNIHEGAMKDMDLLAKDPLLFANAFRKAMEDKGILDPLKQQQEVFKAIGTGPAQRAMYDMIRNSGQMMRERDSFMQASGSKAGVGEINDKSYSANMKAFNAEWENFLKIAGSTLVPTAVKMLQFLTEGLTGLKNFSAEHAGAVKIFLESLAIFGGTLVVAGIIAIGGALVGLAGIAGLLVAAAGGVAVFVGLHWDTLSGYMGKFCSAIDRMFTIPWGTVADDIAKFTDAIKNLISYITGAAAVDKPNPDAVRPGVETPGGAVMRGPNTGKRSSFVPPPTGGNSGGQKITLMMDRKKIGEAVMRDMNDKAATPVQGFAGFDPTFSHFAVDHVYS